MSYTWQRDPDSGQFIYAVFDIMVMKMNGDLLFTVMPIMNMRPPYSPMENSLGHLNWQWRHQQSFIFDWGMKKVSSDGRFQNLMVIAR